MTQPQSGIGTTPERARRGKVVVMETFHAGQIAQRDCWPDIVAYLLDMGMLTADDDYGWQDYCRLRHGMAGTGNGGEGYAQQAWLIFQKILGYKHLRILHELDDYPVPSNSATKNDINWRVGRCLPLIRNALGEASKAAQEARKQIEILKNPK